MIPGDEVARVVEAQREAREVLELVGVAVVVVRHLLARALLALDARAVGELDPRVLGRAGRRVLQERQLRVDHPLARDVVHQDLLRLLRLRVHVVEVVRALRRLGPLLHNLEDLRVADAHAQKLLTSP